MKCILLAALMSIFCQGADFRGAEFHGLAGSLFLKEQDRAGTVKVKPEINWDELVISWNLRGAGEATIEARIVHGDQISKWYNLGVWSAAKRESVKEQNDSDAKVDTDTLIAKKAGGQVEARVTLKNAKPDELSSVAFSFKDTKTKPEPLEPNKKAWGKVIEVRTRSQLDYPEGAKNWCSPTSSSMILDYWSQKLNRPELSMPVPDVAKAVYDPNWPGTGNWPFNTALAGNFPGMRGYITRLSDVSELEDWIEAGIPIATSVSYNRLKGRGTAGSGHLIVCVGFAENGDIIVNDPGTQLSNVRRTFSRDLFRQAWADSHNTVYIIYPENATIPPARFHHWEQK